MKLSDTWIIVLFKGVLLIIFGIVTLAWTPISFLILSTIISIYLLISGMLNIVHGIIGMSQHTYWFLTLLIGIIEIGVGAFALSRPLIALLTFVILVGIAFIIRGALEIIVALDKKYAVSTKIMLIIVGVLEALAGIIFLRYPITGGLTFVWILGVMAVVAGPILIALAINAKEFNDDLFMS